MKNFLKRCLEFQSILGIDTSFDFVTGRDFFNQIINNNKYKKIEQLDDIVSNIYEEKNKLPNKLNKNSQYNNQLNKTITPDYDKQIIKNDFNANIDISNIKDFNDLEQAIQNIDNCDLKRYAKNTVIYDGNKNAKIMLIGEAPGVSEDQEGIPFCGQSGKLLRKALKYIKLDTTNLFITNTIYWRPPENRKPTEEELEICHPFMLKMIEIINPKIIILCGATAIESILKIKQKISQLTGKFYTTNINSTQTKLFPIYHPSYLLRQPSVKKIFWEHLLILEKEIQKTLSV